VDFTKLLWNILSAIALLIVFGYITIFTLLWASLSGGFYLLAFISTVAVVAYCILILMLFSFFKTKRRKQIIAGISILAIVIAAIQPIKHMMNSRVPIVNAEVDIYQYKPFTDDNLVVNLPIKASFHLAEPLPIIDGATAFYPLYAAVAEAIYPEKRYDPFESEVMVNTTPIAYQNLIEGRVDLIVALAPSIQQLNRAKAQGVELKLTPIGKEAFVFFVNTKNDIDGLTLQQIKAIYTGEITNWSEVGGANDAIRAFQRPQDSGSQTALQNLMGDLPIMEALTENVSQGMGGIIEEVANYRNYKNAIGYTFRYYSNEMVQNKEIKLLEIDGVAPTKEMIRSEAYPITNEFYIVTTQDSDPKTQLIIDWMLSDEGQQLLEKAGYVPIRR
jgi:phosphate transport system substrate-binding protein